MQFKYDTFGAYVMFPYSNEEEFKKHKFYHILAKKLSNVRLSIEYIAFYQYNILNKTNTG